MAESETLSPTMPAPAEKKAPSVSLVKNTWYMVRTVSDHYVGYLVSNDHEYVTLGDSQWVADMGSYTHALKTGECNEIEDVPEGVLQRLSKATIVAVIEWPVGRRGTRIRPASE